jgi:hypothetical protein
MILSRQQFVVAKPDSRCVQAGLMDGVLDDVDRTVRIKWIQPKVLDRAEVAGLLVRLDDWLSKVHTTMLHMESETELIAA